MYDSITETENHMISDYINGIKPGIIARKYKIATSEFYEILWSLRIKYCPCCESIKNIVEFTSHSSRPLGLSDKCRSCINVKSITDYSSNSKFIKFLIHKNNPPMCVKELSIELHVLLYELVNFMEKNELKQYLYIRCTECNEILHIDNFYNAKSRVGVRGKCKRCCLDLHDEYVKRNIDVIREYQREYMVERYRTDIKFKINECLSTAIYLSLKGNKHGKHWESLVNYTLADLIFHIEKLFKPGMTWNNYGKDWHIDHVKPKSLFEFNSYDDHQFHECWSLSNLQPLWAEENRKKSNRFIG